MSPAMTNRLTPALIAAVLALPLAGCLGLSGPKPPPTLFTLSAPEMAELPSRSAKSGAARSEEHTSELLSLMRISYAVFCLQKKIQLQDTLTSFKTTITQNISTIT